MKGREPHPRRDHPGDFFVISRPFRPGTPAFFSTQKVSQEQISQSRNGNIYDNKGDVYLNGGPQNCGPAGLDDGDYYFQVTNPGGSLLLSSDAVSERRVTVLGGVITAYDGTTHGTGVGPCNSVTVQLIPYGDTDNNGGEYKVWMTPVEAYDSSATSGTFGFADADSKTDNFHLRASFVCPPDHPDCQQQPSVTGLKWYDANTDGVPDSGKVGIAGWKIVNTGPNSTTVTYTDGSGNYAFTNLDSATTYTISEVLANPSWIATTATSGSVTTGSGGNTPDPNFGNVCLGGGGGLTLGFWSNKNGQALFGADDLALMVSLNLRNANGSNFDPTSYSAFRTWILNATATNMAYMLSAQLASMELNVNNGFVSSSALIYAPGTNSANAAGFASVGAIVAEANTELGVRGTAFAGDSWRSYQEALKNALDNANNNRTFVQSGPCAFTTPY